MSVTAEIAGTVAELRLTVAGLHAELTRNELVAWTAGNVSARVPGQDLMVIKPCWSTAISSGVSYDELSAAGHVADPSVVTRIDDLARAATGHHHLGSLKLARFGDNMRDVAVTDGDKVEAELKFGVSVNTYGVNDLVEIVDAASDEAIDGLVADYADAYLLVPELRRGGERHESLRYAARTELGLRQFLTEGGFGAFTTNFEDLGGVRQLPGLAVQRLMADGYGFGGEGDWKTSALIATVKAMGDGTGLGTSFMEDYTYHFGPGEAKILGAHMLEVCPSIAVTRPSCEIHPLGIGGREDPVRLVFDAAPGPAVVLALSDLRPVPVRGQRSRGRATGRAAAEPAGGQDRVEARAVADDLGRGVDHRRRPASHGAQPAVGPDTVRDFAHMLDTELLVIDQDTTPAAFGDRIRWNQAYYRIAQGF
jgi:L-arabinose isomerase